MVLRNKIGAKSLNINFLFNLRKSIYLFFKILIQAMSLLIYKDMDTNRILNLLLRITYN